MEEREATIKTTISKERMRGSFMILPSYNLLLCREIMNNKEDKGFPALPWSEGTLSFYEKRIEIENFWTGKIDNIEGKDIYGLSNALNDVYSLGKGFEEPWVLFTGAFRKPFSRWLGIDLLSNLASCVYKDAVKEKDLKNILKQFWWFIREPWWWKDYDFVYTDDTQRMDMGPREYKGKKRPIVSIELDFYVVALVKWDDEKYKKWNHVSNPLVHRPKITN